MSPDGLAPFMTRAMREAPYLDRETEASVASRAAAGDASAMRTLILSHGRLVAKAAHRMRGYGLPFEDLVQEGNVGLLEAAKRFRPDHEVRFATYAAWWIKALMQEYVLRNWSIVRGGSSAKQKALFFSGRKLAASIRAATPDLPDLAVYAKVGEALGAQAGEVEAFLSRFGSADSSLDAPIGDEDGGALSDMLRDEAPLPDEAVLSALDSQRSKDRLMKAVVSLGPRERRIIETRFLREDEERATLDDLGAELHLSRERIRQLEAKALRMLRETLGAKAVGGGVEDAAGIEPAASGFGGPRSLR